MENWVKEWLEKERAKGKKRLEIKQFGRAYYVYESTTIWDKKEKKRRKVSKYVGKLTTEGVIKGVKRLSVRSIYEYGNGALLKKYIGEIKNPLREAFPEYYQEIIAMGIVKTIEPLPIKLIGSRWEKLYLSQTMKACLSPKTISKLLKEIGSDWTSQNTFFESILMNKKVLFFDLSSIFTHSENILLAEKGYNRNHLYLKQINFLLFFSLEQGIPVMLKPIPGSIKDINALKSVLREGALRSAVLVVDRGLASYKLAKMLHDMHISYIMPLRRNFEIIDYNMRLKKFFTYRNRGIKWNKKKIGNNYLYVYEDVKLRAEEESTFIELMEKKKKKKREYEHTCKKFGKIAILSDINADGEEVYRIYKQREEIECAFDAFKNTLECDKTYLQDDDAVRGFFFISFISLYLYYRILGDLKNAGLLNKISVKEILLEFSKVYMIVGKDKTLISDVPHKVMKLHDALKLNLFPKNLRS